jgi:hypothetical protein
MGLNGALPTLNDSFLKCRDGHDQYRNNDDSFIACQVRRENDPCPFEVNQQSDPQEEDQGGHVDQPAPKEEAG